MSLNTFNINRFNFLPVSTSIKRTCQNFTRQRIFLQSTCRTQSKRKCHSSTCLLSWPPQNVDKFQATRSISSKLAEPPFLTGSKFGATFLVKRIISSSSGRTNSGAGLFRALQCPSKGKTTTTSLSPTSKTHIIWVIYDV